MHRIAAVLVIGLVLGSAEQASAQGRISAIAGAAMVDTNLSGDDAYGPIIGGRAAWLSTSSGISVSLDLQPFRGHGSDNTGDFRALYIMPSYDFRIGPGYARAGIGIGVFRFDEVLAGAMTEVVPFTAAGAGLELPASFGLELVWRYANNVRSVRVNTISLALMRTWPL
jgi:hypothetical protein